MRIAIPSEGTKGMDETVAVHFGRCPVYTVVDEDGRLIEALNVKDDVLMHRKLPPDFLKENDIDLVLCRDMGAKASTLCAQLGIKTCTGEGATVRELFESWKKGDVRRLDPGDGCAH